MIKYLKSPEFIETIIVIFIGVAIIGLAKIFDKRYLESKSSNGKWYRSAKMVRDFINLVVVTLLVLIILSINGVNVAKYVTSLGVIGIILSFALQDILKDTSMGISIMFEGYFKVGDCVRYEGRPGKIVSFNIKSTKIFMLDTESTLSVCNRNISQIEVDSDWIDVVVPVGYDVDLYAGRALCKEAAKKIERLRYVYSCDFINTQELGESSIQYKLRIHCLPEKKIPVRRNANAVVQDVFYEHKASFPYNVLVINQYDEMGKVEVLNKGDLKVIATSEERTKQVHRHKSDYEYGRGAEKSKVCSFDGTDESLKKAMTEAERYTSAENLSNGMKLRMRLLSEELLSMTRGLPNLKNGKYHIDRDSEDYEICFDADAKINKKTRDSLIEVSSTNTNEAYMGLGGVISYAIDSMMIMSIDDKSGVNKATMGKMEESIGKNDEDYRWSYNVYKEKEKSYVENDDIDESEIVKSVLTSLSDDIKISVRANHVNIRVLVKSEDED